MDACDALDTLAADPELVGRLVHREVLPARPAQYADAVRAATRARSHDRIRARGIDRLFTHQAEAIDKLRTGTSVVIATGTASGKSLCYQVPIVESVVTDRRDTALLIFPTKALAHDQLRAMRSWLVPGHARGHLRRRHDHRRPRLGAQERQRRAHQPRHAARRDPAVAPAVGHVHDAAPLRRGRRAAHAARDLRQSRRARAAPAAPHLRALRREPHVLLRERDDRQPRRARDRAVRPAGRADRPRRIAALRTRARVLAAAAPRRALRRTRRRPTSRPPSCSPGSSAPATPRSRSRAAAAAPSSSRSTPRAAARAVRARARRARRRVPRRLPRVRAARARARRSRAAACSASRPRTRSSSASTSAASTRSCSTASPERSRRCGNRPVARAAPIAAPRPCSSPATTSSTSGTSRIRPSSPGARPSGRS